MKILVIGGTRFLGIPMVNELLANGHEVTIASRQTTKDPFGDRVARITLQRTDPESVKNALKNQHFDVVIDKIAYCSNDIKSVLDVIDCDKYIQMSSTAVYEPIHWDSKEGDFDAIHHDLIWCSRPDFPYDEIKRQAECALCQEYSDKDWIAVRYPFVIGTTDYTNRLFFYVEHTMKSLPMYIDNLDCQMSFIRFDEAGKFMAFLVDKDYTGAINGASSGTISIRQILDYVESKTGTKAILDPKSDVAPYNQTPEYSINTEKAQNLGFQFTNLNDWIFDLLDYYIAL